MNKEIEEIITRLKKENRYMNSRKIILCESEISVLLDYITDLQKRLDFMIDRNDEKQDRIDKAIEYIEEAQEIDGDDEACSLHIPTLKAILKGDE